MEYINFALAILGAIITVFAFSWTVFKGMLNEVKKDVMSQIDQVKKDLEFRDIKTETRINKIMEEREDLISQTNVNISSLREIITNKPSYDYIDKKYAPREVVDLKFSAILDKMGELMKKIDEVLNNKKGAHGEPS